MKRHGTGLLRARTRGAFALIGLPTLIMTGLCSAAIAAGSGLAAPRITANIDEANLAMAGSVAPLALPAYDQGAVQDNMAIEHVLLQLRRSPEQAAALDGLLQAMQDPRSASYHKWLSAEALGQEFGAAQADIDTVTRWLGSHGLHVNLVHKNALTMDLSGTAGQIREAFHTEIHNYLVNGQQHIANATVPQIPAALSPVVAGLVSLHDFHPRPMMRRPKQNFTFTCTGCPDGFNNLQLFDEAPGDLATIYNVTPLYKANKPITGKGQTVVVLEDTDIKSSDVATFRKAFGLNKYAGTFHQIHPGPGCSDPGTNGAEGEASIDAEWAGAVAPDATVKLASCADTTVNFGAFIAAQNLLDESSPPPIMSLSYGVCEAQLGPGDNGNGYIAALWQQAASEGVSVFVSTGDGAAAGCDDFNTAQFATAGIAANGFASTPYNLAAGGTDFADTATGANSLYWSNTNGTGGKSALSYIPEIPWNDSCASDVLFTFLGFPNGISFCNSPQGANFLDIIGASGAPSFVYSKPYWQSGVYGVPNDGVRDLPDVSLFASNLFWNHAILFCMSDKKQGGSPCNYSNPTDALNNSAGGTSFTAPQLASIQALINQKAGGPQGNPAPIYYDLARAEYADSSKRASCNSNQGANSAGSCIFHDVTTGNIDVPCFGTVNCYDPNKQQFGVLSTSDTRLIVAYPAKAGWDFATGLGTLNVTNLVNSWP